jgi:maltose alpha-D-glucosyltransferase / alpha-amylase
MEAPLTRTLADAEQALWYKDAVIYQLHVKSFFDANNDGIGDFPGLISKLDYIAGLGVSAIWLLPFYPSPRLDDGYDISEYRAVHPDYGTMSDVRRFIAAAHERGIRVITELVINHTSDQHPWFQRARKAKPGSATRNFYVWSDNDQKYAGTRIIFLDTERSNWTWDPVAGAYFWHRFYSHQPDLNFDNPRVLNSMLHVMHYWLAMGVDGLRLDAVPYLIEREGTNNENLPETHDILKRIRAELEAHFHDRMLLAEANQWPEDTKDYFGSGDECHMAFHFPLMPRMYMAIAREDRFPITDILRQTPPIPDNCQWAIFLRNHDELTLEMVTDSERDYLWENYAADRRARLNLGIRRRLAPLLERDRRRIELMNSLLLSMPGTPVIYYGDEIGMGDNIYLGDRDGVRTPMQWSPDRNGGFSRADPAKLVLPPIMDPLYGFEAVNVEAQSRDPHSLLNWTRRMLAVRRQHAGFGRGTLRFLYPKNRKVLAYLREHAGDTLLCVANIARTPQAVELDLSEFAGRVPIELSGGSVFPPIGQLTYLLTLPPYGFYWFTLASESNKPSWHTPAPEPMPDYVTIVMRAPLADTLLDGGRAMLEREVLPPYLAKRRWFAAKDQRLHHARLVYAAPLPGTEREKLIAEIETKTDRGTSRWLLPLTMLWEDEQAPALPGQLALARVRRGRRVGLLTDAFALPGFAHGVIKCFAEGTDIPTSAGTIRFEASPQHRDTFSSCASGEVIWLSAEQSNSSLIVGDTIMLKIFRRVEAGKHPEPEMGRYLTEHGFAHVPPHLGEAARVDAQGTPHSLAVAQGFVRNQGDAWTWTLDLLTRAVNEVGAPDADASATADLVADCENFAATVGRRLAEMHNVLARPTDEADFAPETATAAHAGAWAERTTSLLEAAFAIVAQRARGDTEAAQRAAALLSRRDALLAAVPPLAQAGIGSPVTRVHGDFHLGQVLVASGDAYLIDFEGEPAQPLRERRAKSSPLRDVAGLMRSFDYVAATLAERREGTKPPAGEAARAALIGRYRANAREKFLSAYRAAASAGENAIKQDVLDFFLIQKAAYEIAYEAANRPAWIDVPLSGLAALAHDVLSRRVAP